VQQLVKIAAGRHLLHFGVLSSTMHNAMGRITCWPFEKRLPVLREAAIVYNNFPWPFCTSGQPLPVTAAEIENSNKNSLYRLI
jgi:hypothetical protein